MHGHCACLQAGGGIVTGGQAWNAGTGAATGSSQLAVEQATAAAAAVYTAFCCSIDPNMESMPIYTKEWNAIAAQRQH
jgi:hypothetical protein